MSDGLYLEARVLGILLAQPALFEDVRSYIDADWFGPLHSRIFKQLRNTHDVLAMDLTPDQREYAQHLLVFESFTPENLPAYVRELRKREERIRFELSTGKIQTANKPNNRLFKDIP